MYGDADVAHPTAAAVMDAARLAVVLRRHSPNLILHAAAITAVDPASETNYGATMVEVNVVGTLRVLELARDAGVKRMLYISSSGVYGFAPFEAPIAETAQVPEEDIGLYAISKITAERLCLRYAELMGVDVIVGRLNGPYGPMERDTGVRSVMSPIYQVGCAALTRDKVRVRTRASAFDWTYTLDLALAARLLLEAKTLHHRVYNLSGGRSYTLADVIDAFGRVVNGVEFEWVDSDRSEPMDLDIGPGRRQLDVARLRSDVGFAPAYDLECGLRASMPWWRAMLASEGRVLQTRELE